MELKRFSVRSSGRDLNAVRRPTRPSPLRARPTRAPEPVVEATPDLGDMKKDELVALAERMGLDSSGTKADLAERIGSFDG